MLDSATMDRFASPRRSIDEAAAARGRTLALAGAALLPDACASDLD